jgi:hypothetical protein
MLVEIVSLDNGSGMNEWLDVYLSYNAKQKLFEQRPFCKIDTDAFYDMLTDKEVEKATNGHVHFNVSKHELSERAAIIYRKY